MKADREELVEAFDEWKRRYEAAPEAFTDEMTGDTYGEAAADYLIKLLTDQCHRS